MAEIKLDDGRVPARAIEKTEKKAEEKSFRLDPEILAAIEGEKEGDTFWYDESLRPVDMTYEWKRLSYGGKEDVQYQSKVKRFGWVPVPADRHPEVGTEVNNNTIVIGGQVLMERHVEYTKRANAANKRLNDAQIGGMKERLADVGDASMPRKVTAFKQTYESGQIVD